MPVADIPLAIPYTIGGVAVFVISYLLFFPEKAEKVAGWLLRILSYVWQGVDRKAVAISVQGAINDACAQLAKDVPLDIFSGKLRISWARPDEARALVRNGEVVVFLRRSEYLEDNVATALMAFLPKAVVPETREYVRPHTMQGVDLTLARNILAQNNMPAGARDTFRERYIDPVKQKAELQVAFQQADQIDVQGWMTRILLVEYKLLSGYLIPSDADTTCLDDGDDLRTWLYSIASLTPGTQGPDLEFQSRYYNTAIIFMGLGARLRREGLSPYRNRVNRLVHEEQVHTVYVVARDASIAAVDQLAETLVDDPSIEALFRCEYPLRRDFSARMGFRRTRGVCLCLRRREIDPQGLPAMEDEDDPDFPPVIDDRDAETHTDEDEAVAAEERGRPRRTPSPAGQP